MMNTRKYQTRLLTLEVIGFGIIIAMFWLNEIMSLPQVLFGGDHYPNWREAATETLVVVLVAVPVILLTRKMLVRLHYLEDFVRVCAWCKRAEYEGAWLSLDALLAKRFATTATHGICPECAEKALADLPKTRE